MTKLRYSFWKLIGWLFQYPIKQVLLLQEPEPNSAPLPRSPNVWEQLIQDRFSRAEEDRQEAERVQEEFYRSNSFKSSFIKLIDYCLQRFEHETGAINVGSTDVEMLFNNPKWDLFRKKAIAILKEQGIKASPYRDSLICVDVKSFGKLVEKIKSRQFPLPAKLETITEGPYR